MKSNTLFLLLVFASLCLGVLIYATTRSDVLYLNQWLASLGFSPVKIFLSGILPLSSLPHWIRYSLPDGLWMLALTLCILMIWNLKLNKQSLPWIGLTLLFGIGFEIFQGFHWIAGSFDVMDLWLMMLGVLLPVSILLIKFHLCKNY